MAWAWALWAEISGLLAITQGAEHSQAQQAAGRGGKLPTGTGEKGDAPNAQCACSILHLLYLVSKAHCPRNCHADPARTHGVLVGMHR